MDQIEIEICNWDKFNPRSDRKNHSWFRLQNDIAIEPKFFGLTAEQKFIAICLFAEASKKSGKRVTIILDWFAHHLGVTSSVIVETIRSLETTGVVAVSCGYQSVSLRLTTDVRTDDTNERRQSGKKTETKKNNQELKASVAEAPSPSSQFIGAYVQAYRKRYGEKARPDLSPKVQGGIKRLLGGVSLERACEMIQVYLQMDDPWFDTKKHDFGSFEQNLTKVGLALDTGKSGGIPAWQQEVLDKEKRENENARISGPGSEAQKLFRGEGLPK